MPARSPRFSFFAAARRWARPLYLLEALAGVLLWLLLRPLPPRLVSALGGFCARIIGPLLPAHKTACANLAAALPQMPARGEVIAAMWDNLGRTSLEYVHLPVFARRPQRYIRVIACPPALAAMTQNPRRVLFFSGHFANWELLTLALKPFGIPAAGFYRAPNNPYAAFWLTRLRRHIMPYQLAKHSGVGAQLRSYMRRNIAFAMLADQALREVKTQFFGRPAWTSAMPAIFALRFGYSLIPANIVRDGPGPHFSVNIFPPLTLPASGDYDADVLALTQKVSDFLEARIRANPAQWLWAHDRWKA